MIHFASLSSRKISTWTGRLASFNAADMSPQNHLAINARGDYNAEHLSRNGRIASEHASGTSYRPDRIGQGILWIILPASHPGVSA